MKIRVRTVKVGDTAPCTFRVPDDIAIEQGPELDAFRQKCVHTYRSGVLQTAAEIIHEADDVAPVKAFISNQRMANAAKGLVD